MKTEFHTQLSGQDRQFGNDGSCCQPLPIEQIQTNMNYGFVKVAAAVPHVQVADCFYNIDKIEGLMRKASEKAYR